MDAWDACIDRLYDAVGHEDALAQALGALRPFFGARGVTYLSIPDMSYPQTFHAGAVGVPEQSLLEYHAHFNVFDEWVRAGSARVDFGPGAVYRGSELVPPETLRASHFWDAFLRRYRIADILTAVVDLSSQHGPSTFLTFQRHDDQPLFVPEDRERLLQLAPHLSRVLKLHRRLAPAVALSATLKALVHRIDVPLFFVGSHGRLLECNTAGQQHLSNPGSWLLLQHGRLRPCDARCAADYEAAIARLEQQQQAEFEVPLLNAAGQRALLELRRMNSVPIDSSGLEAAIAVCTLRTMPADSQQALRMRHGLTPAEARIAQQLAQGRTAADIATASGISITTVRSHIRAALEKTGLSRQVQLVALVLSKGG